ncbi:hypothetical protein BREVNS_2389 [Brevinematales bacterium NS]|nr:hypothetical protein [Brevinematales bacterium]QJR23139.1 hypothetical protein BREVNS_2389 [Brevinematales bacterium NS]
MTFLGEGNRKFFGEDVFQGNEKIENASFRELVEILEILFAHVQEMIEKDKEKEKEVVFLVKNSLCHVCFSREVAAEFQKRAQHKLQSDMKIVIELLERMKTQQNENYHRLLTLVRDFSEAVENGKIHGKKNDTNINEFFVRTKNLQKNIAEALHRYFEQFKKIEKVFREMEEIFQQMRLITLNLSVEANKSQNRVFHVIAQELHNLSLRTQNLARTMIADIKNSIEKTEEEREERLKEIEEVNQQIELTRVINEEFSGTIQGLYRLVGDLTEVVNFFVEDKKDIHQSFHNIQKVQINNEIMEHAFRIMNKVVLFSTDHIHGILGGKKGACIDAGFRSLITKQILEELKGIVTTEDEREWLKELYKKYLNVEINVTEDLPEDRVILFE